MSKVYELKFTQTVPAPLTTVWNFFSTPANLQLITPPHLGFRIISKHHGNLIYPGQIIEYNVAPLLGIQLYWMTEITHVKHEHFFVDEQRFGPYRFWHHQHHFKSTPNGVEMTDIVHYKLPLGFLGSIAHQLLVKKQLANIFKHRFSAVEQFFSSEHNGL
jgi:ligand-binding SRPBCC domain-containing protein